LFNKRGGVAILGDIDDLMRTGKKSILACSAHSTRPLNMLPTADLGELRDPVLAVPAV